MKALPLTIVLLVLAAACHQIADYPTQPPVTREAIADVAVVKRIRAKDIDELQQLCATAVHRLDYGCALERRYVGAVPTTVAFCTIVVIEPRDFNDVPKLALQGHELDHCFGREHA